MFKVGDVVVHPRYGIAIIEKMRTIGKKRYFCLRLDRDNDKSIVMIPEDGIDGAGLRTKLLSAAVIQGVMAQEPGGLGEDAHPRQKLIASTMQNNDPHVLVGLLRDLCWLETEKKLSQGEAKARKHLLSILENELSISQNIDSTSAQEKLQAIIDDAIETHQGEVIAPTADV
jgi:RNA polymerase-interacting CarD/CdnL/TRCF family regulator